MKKRKLGLSTKTFIILISLSAVFLLVTVLIQTAFFGSFYASTKKQEINEALKSVLEEISGDVANLQSACDEYAHYYNVCILVTDENMITLASAEGSPECSLLRLSTNALRTFYENAKNNGGTYTKEIEPYRPQPSDRFGGEPDEDRFDRNSGNTLLKVSVVTTDGGKTRVVFVNSLITPVKNMTDSLRGQLIVLSFIMLVLSIVLSYIYSKHLSKPIIEMNNEADKLAKGDFDVHFEQSSGSRELDELGEKLNHAASELSKVNSLRSELIANVSHDLRTPLTLITGYSEMMRDLPGENNIENLNLIIDESKRLSQIVNDVLDISKYQSGSVQFKKEVFCITDEILSIKDRLSAFTSSNGFTFSFDYSDEILVNADKNAISRVIYNLISNAINYTGSENKAVEIIQTAKDKKVKIEVVDHGKGISQEDLPYVFDRYYRSSESHVRSVLGSGLGLSIVKTILIAHDAEFGVLSSPGHGSDFWFALDTVNN